jgi:hypothetical protein
VWHHFIMEKGRGKIRTVVFILAYNADLDLNRGAQLRWIRI